MGRKTQLNGEKTVGRRDDGNDGCQWDFFPGEWLLCLISRKRKEVKSRKGGRGRLTERSWGCPSIVRSIPSLINEWMPPKPRDGIPAPGSSATSLAGSTCSLSGCSPPHLISIRANIQRGHCRRFAMSAAYRPHWSRASHFHIWWKKKGWGEIEFRRQLDRVRRGARRPPNVTAASHYIKVPPFSALLSTACLSPAHFPFREAPLHPQIEHWTQKEGRLWAFTNFPCSKSSSGGGRKESRFGAGIVKLNCAKMERFFAELTFAVQQAREREGTGGRGM